MKTLTAAFFLFLGHFIYAQNKVDKLIDSLSFASNDRDKVLTALSIADELKETDWKRALHYVEYSETLLNQINDEEFTADANNRIAATFNDNDALDIALSYFLKAYEYYQTKEDEKKYDLEGSLAIIYARLNNTERARYYFNKLLKHYTAIGDKTHIAKVYNNIGKLHFTFNNSDSAAIYYNKSLELSKQIKDTELELVLYNNLGLLKVSQQNFNEAKAYFDKSRILAEQGNDKKNKAWIYNSLSKLYLTKKEPDSALFYAQNAANMLTGQKFSFENFYALENLYKSYLQKGDYKNAAECFEDFNIIRDSLNIEMKAVNVQRLNLEQQYKENEELRLLKENKKQFTYLIFGFGFIIILLILVILLLRYRNKLTQAKLEKDLFESKKKELDANLELRNKELITKSMMEIQRGEIIEQILDDLKKLRLQSPKKENQHAIDTIIKQLKKDNTSDIWQEFELRYGQVYEDFYNILSQKHPELTSRDKRLCALLKLNLTTKEIAAITGQSVKSLENARTRLRKKLDITNTSQSLISYLESLQ